MAIKVESFLAIEQSLFARLRNAVRREVAKKVATIGALAEKGQMVRASDLIYELDITPVIRRNLPALELAGMQSILFGGREYAPKFKWPERPEILSTAVEGMVTAIIKVGNDHLRQRVTEMLKDFEYDLIQKQTLAERVWARVARDSDFSLEVASSLHTSRLASWGHLVVAESFGRTTYEVDEILDGKTCGVCRIMDGRVFPVRSARIRLEEQLAVSSADELKSIARWPAQDRESLSELRAMSDQEIVSRGWDTPPYHPMCRGVLSRTESPSPLNVNI